MSVLDDLGLYLEDVGVGIPGETLFLGQVPLDVPGVAVQDALLALIEVPGLPPERVHTRRDAVIEQPVIQVLARGLQHDYVEARTRAQTAWLALDGLANVTLNGTHYLWIQALQSPFLLRTDAMGRAVIIFNIRCAKALAAAPPPRPAFVQPFLYATTVSVPGVTHRLATADLLVTVYDAESPAALVQPGLITVDGSTFDVSVSFAGPQSGRLVLAAATTPGTRHPFTAATLVRIPGTLHGLGTADLLVTVYDTGVPATQVESGLVGIHPTTYEVTVSFPAPQSGVVLLTSAAAGYGLSFPSQTLLVIPGSTHQLGTRDLVPALYDTSVPAVRLAPQMCTVHPTTFEVRVAFAGPQEGRLVLYPAKE